MTTPFFQSGMASYLPESRVFPEDWDQFLIQMTQIYNEMAQSINLKQIGNYLTINTDTGQQFFNAVASTATQPIQTRQAYRTVYPIGAIAPGATSTTVHGLKGVTAYTHIYGTCITAIPDNRPIPYSNVTLATNQIEIEVDATNIYVLNGSTAPAITSAIIILEYLLN